MGSKLMAPQKKLAGAGKGAKELPLQHILAIDFANLKTQYGPHFCEPKTATWMSQEVRKWLVSGGYNLLQIE